MLDFITLEKRIKNLELELLKQKELNADYLKAFSAINESLHSQSDTIVKMAEILKDQNIINKEKRSMYGRKN